jgi:hypothetical protein
MHAKQMTHGCMNKLRRIIGSRKKKQRIVTVQERGARSTVNCVKALGSRIGWPYAVCDRNPGHMNQTDRIANRSAQDGNIAAMSDSTEKRRGADKDSIRRREGNNRVISLAYRGAELVFVLRERRLRLLYVCIEPSHDERN